MARSCCIDCWSCGTRGASGAGPPEGCGHTVKLAGDRPLLAGVRVEERGVALLRPVQQDGGGVDAVVGAVGRQRQAREREERWHEVERREQRCSGQG
eukprot:SAG11_NODE_750_length_7360_cov_7.329522_8_plen_97_part_00